MERSFTNVAKVSERNFILNSVNTVTYNSIIKKYTQSPCANNEKYFNLTIVDETK